MTRSRLLPALALPVLLLAGCAEPPAAGVAGSPSTTATSTTGTPTTATPTTATPTTVVTLSTPTASVEAPGKAELVAAEARWADAVGASSYRFTYQPQCFCPHDPYVVTVTDGVVTAVRFAGKAQSGQPLPPLTGIATVAAMFRQLHDAYDGGGDDAPPAAEVKVAYDATYGYPSSVFIDWDKNSADEEAGYSLSGFRILTPTPSASAS